MKELSIEEKARRYDEVKNKLSRFIAQGVDPLITRADVQDFFPELKESEDEKIRRALIRFHKSTIDVDGIKGEDILAWLEKQGDANKEYWRGYREGKQEILDKYAELEKQGEQEVPVNDFKAKDWYVSKVDGKIHNINYTQDFAPKSAMEAIKEENVDNQNYIKSTDEIEPKFHEGEWIIRCCGKIYHILDIVDSKYYVEDYNGEREYIYFANSDIYRLWTIQDAKDGDVLIDKSGSRECPFIFKETKPSDIKTDMLNPLTVLGYCGIGGAGFTKGSGWGDTANCIYYPATKEQRDTLMKAMNDEGYSFDFEKKELKEIEEEVNGEDYGIDGLYHAQRILEKTLGEVEGYQSDDGILEHKCAITAVKKLYAQKPVKWSEDDENRINRLIAYFEDKESFTADDDIVYTHWLKSLKQRIGG